MKNVWMLGSSVAALVVALVAAIALMRGGPEPAGASVRLPAVPMAPTVAPSHPADVDPRSSAAAAPDSPRPYKSRRVVWNGENRNGGYGWAVDGCWLKSQQIDTHSGHTAMEFHALSRQYVVCGWNWIGTVAGPGSDVSGMTRLTFWAKLTGPALPTQLHLDLRSSTDDPERHHTAKIDLLRHCPALDDGQWHEIVIPLADLYREESEFDPRTARELQVGAYAPEGQVRRFSFYIDDVAFDDAPVER